MKLKHIYLVSAALLTGSLFSSCGEDIENYDNQIFMTAKTPESILVMSTSPDEERSFTLSIAKPETADVTFTMRVAPELVSVYELQNYTSNVEMLPDAHYELSNTNGKILAGSLNSAPITVKFKDVKGLDVKKVYVLPITIANASIGVLGSANTYYYVFKEGHLVNLAANIKENAVYPEKWATPDKFKNLSTLTMEALIRPHSLTNGISTLMGIEGTFLLRFGDNSPKDQLQIVIGGNGTPEKKCYPEVTTKLEQWVHIAVTYNAIDQTVKAYYDGELKSTDTGVSYGPVDLSPDHSNDSDGKPRSFWVGHSYNDDRWLDADIAEVRIWNKELTQEEIQSPNHFYQIADVAKAEAEGLLVYWKFDEKNDEIKDATSNGNNGKALKSISWVEVSLPENK